jgi:hypothetical protein
LRALSKYTDINVSNDLTKTERASEKELWEEAKKMNDKDDSWDYKYKMGALSSVILASLYSCNIFSVL